ncbi:hypothetical protein ABMA27_014522 [Loxostege sticticalis]|uniref:Fanconi anemia group I protein n=1 Tax=Loxostege sticticalis TaxID=481309 RepID=A0ABR3I996_LOXSC
MDRMFLKIKELGHVNSKRDELAEYCKANIDQILKSLPRRILNSDGADVLDCLLNGLTDNPSSSSRFTVKIIDIVLQSMRKESTSLTHCSDVISRLCLELSRQTADDLVRWSNDSVQSIIGDSDVNMIWCDILPECLNALSSYSEIKHCGTNMTFDEYKQQCIHTLCQCKWTEKQLVQLVAMFKDLQLPRNEHKQVVNKVCSYIINISPDELPPLVHQLLKLCKLYNVDIVLAHLSHYFSVRLYSKLEPPPQDSESTTMDIDDIVTHSAAELSRCLSTCIYHITDGAADPALVRRQLKAWPKTQLLRAPFACDLALALAEKGPDFRAVCLDSIKLAIERRVLDELRAKESAWVRSVLPPDVDIASVLKVLTTESANHRQLTVVGLINLAFSLLATNKVKPVAPACWSHGKLILVRLCKAQPETASHILSQLSCRLATDSTQRQYADCLHVLCKLTPVSIERCTELSTILENCQPSPHDYRAAAAVLCAVHPLINFSTRTRDTLVMVCRKGLYSRDSAHRCLALSGFLTVLRHMKLARGTFSRSQSVCSQYSGHSYLTQLTVDLHATQQNVVTSRVRNEAMCMEVVSILRRCLVQDAAVKQLLYSNLYDCAAEKTALHESILELLYEHLSKYLPEPDSNGPTLLLEKCVQLNAASAVLTEPISHLLYSIAEFLQPTEEEDLEDILSSQAADTGSAYLKSKLGNILEQVCGNDNLGQIDMEDPGLTDLLPESKAKCLKVQQILQIYEALIAHRIMQWSLNSSNAASKVYSLYKACNELLEKTKAPPKSKKGNKTLNETKETVKSQKSQKSQKDKGKGPVKVSALTKDRAGPFKPLPCVWDLRFCLRIVELLYSEEVSWSSVEQRNQLRGRRDFHHWALRCVLSVLSDEHLDKGMLAKYAPKLAAVMYTRCLCRFQDMCDFDDQTALGCIEVFKACLTLLLSPNYSLKIESVLPLITGIAECTASVGLAAILEQLLTALELVEEEAVAEERDLSIKKHCAALVQTAALLLDAPVVPCPKLSGVIIKYEEYLRTSKQDCLALIPAVLAAGCRDQQEATLMDQLLVKLATALGRVDEEDTSAGEESPNFPTIDSRTGHTVLSYICAHVALRLKRSEHLLLRARDLGAALATAPHHHLQRVQRELKELYKSTILQLCQLTTWISGVSKLRCCVGQGSDRVLGACVRLYSLLVTLVKQLPPDLASALRLERLLKLSGKKFSGVTDNLISYIELSQQQQKASRVLQDTKLIPRLVAEAEQFSNHVILLANKAKLNLQHYLSPGTARDFRIRQPLLQEALNARPPSAEDPDETRDNEELNDAATVMISPAASDKENEDDSDEETTRKKRRRVS